MTRNTKPVQRKLDFAHGVYISCRCEWPEFCDACAPIHHTGDAGSCPECAIAPTKTHLHTEPGSGTIRISGWGWVTHARRPAGSRS